MKLHLGAASEVWSDWPGVQVPCLTFILARTVLCERWGGRAGTPCGAVWNMAADGVPASSQWGRAADMRTITQSEPTESVLITCPALSLTSRGWAWEGVTSRIKPRSANEKMTIKVR